MTTLDQYVTTSVEVMSEDIKMLIQDYEKSYQAYESFCWPSKINKGNHHKEVHVSYNNSFCLEEPAEVNGIGSFLLVFVYLY